ncbi:hypothetical protein CDD80_3361 [Ophiocordyceps camponoti-rufipedis]|uniref:Uncharacterized protein n=1 Tax=Ophiocordyceps camponoti-rufipedis TaxID=2004952 RepID=A0A2C5XZI4_9HYPO|nr:hypothetical protein CDD80_3361 [Ophiocordyceps camponoti-rufipedis]
MYDYDLAAERVLVHTTSTHVLGDATLERNLLRISDLDQMRHSTTGPSRRALLARAMAAVSGVYAYTSGGSERTPTTGRLYRRGLTMQTVFRILDALAMTPGYMYGHQQKMVAARELMQGMFEAHRG